ncbi:hypothetical protein [Daejeonella sp.]|uniref:HYC_CC_PP family protein n=1 Tax=Daejeonella sp. TaxID=2805397 RepID=UPI0030C34D0C
MKKFIIILLATFYLGVSSGATVHLHYCMGKLMDWSMNYKKATKCGNCGMEKGDSKDCCKDQQHKLELKESLKASAIVFHFNISAVEAPLAAFIGQDKVYVDPVSTGNYPSKAPSRTPDTPVYLRNCSFRI